MRSKSRKSLPPSFVLALVILAGLMEHNSAWPAPKPASSRLAESPVRKPLAVVTIKPGETASVQLCWDDGSSGIGEAILLGSNPELTDEQRNGPAGIARFDRDGLVAEVDEKESVAVQAALYQWAEKTRKKGESVRHFKAVVIRLMVAQNAALGIRPLFVHVRHYYHAVGMFPPNVMAGEIRLLVRE